MKAYLITFMFTLSLFTSVKTTTTSHRRILHQPLFPANSSPPPSSETPSYNPFFHEHTPDQPSSPPPQPDTAATEVVKNNTAAHRKPAENSGKKIAVVISVGVVTVGMLLGLVYFIYKFYKYKLKKYDNRTTFCYAGAAESPITATELPNERLNGSPYHKLNSVKLSDRYRPSPELQPLPPLSKLKPAKPYKPAAAAMASSDEDDDEIYDFNTPHGSIASTDDGYFVGSLNSKPIRYSKRASPRSRLSVSSAGHNRRRRN